MLLDGCKVAPHRGIDEGTHDLHARIGVGLWRNRRGDRAWHLVVAGIAIWAAGDSYWNVFRLVTGREAPFPSPAPEKCDGLFFMTVSYWAWVTSDAPSRNSFGKAPEKPGGFPPRRACLAAGRLLIFLYQDRDVRR